MNIFTRTHGIRAARAKDSEDLEFALSSEEPVERWFGIEILDHSPSAVDLTRLGDGRHPLLLNHDSDRQIGVVARAWLDPEARVVRAAARFSRSALGSEIRQDVEDDIRTLVSVGYYADEIREEKRAADGSTHTRTLTGEQFDAEMRAQHGDQWFRELGKGERRAGDDPPVYRVTRWTPFEASVVPIPADVTVGKGRSASPAVPEPAASVPQTTTHVTVISQEKPKMDQQVTQDEARKRALAAVFKIAEQNADYLKPADIRQFAERASNGELESVEKLYDLVLERMKSGATQVTAESVGVSKRELKQYSFVRAVAAQIPNPNATVDAGLEREISKALARAMGREPEGFYVPPEWFAGKRDFNVGTAGEAGNLVQTVVMADMFTDALRPALVLAQLGATVLPGLRSNIQIPRKSVAGTLAFVTEIAAATETQPNTALVPMTPRRISSFVEPSKQAIIQAEIGVEAMLRQDLLDGAAGQIENAGINGNATPPNPRGIRFVAGVGSVAGGTNGLAFNWSHATGLEAAVANVNAEPSTRAGYLTNTRIRNTAKNTQKATNLQFIWDRGAEPLNGYRAGITNWVPNNLTKGTSVGICSSVIYSSDWSMHVLGLFGGLDVTVDPYTLASTAQVRITLNQFIDWATRQPGAFAVMDDALTP